MKKENKFLPEIENKLLEIRNKRGQPFTDKKIVTSWNSLLGVGFIMAYRFLGDEKYLEKAESLFESLLKKHYNKNLIHSSLEKKLQEEGYLEDYSSMLLFASYLFEETGKYKEIIQELSDKIKHFQKEGVWYENKSKDFIEVPASGFDHPTPSSLSLVEMALLRVKILFGEEYDLGEYKNPLSSDFYNLSTFIRNGGFHIIHSPKKVTWDRLPVNCIQVKSDKIQDCFGKKCKSLKDLENYLKSN